MEKEKIKWLEWSGNVEEWGKIECPMLGNEWVMTYYPKGTPIILTLLLLLMKAETYATTDLTMTKDAGRKMLFIPYVKVKSIKRA